MRGQQGFSGRVCFNVRAVKCQRAYLKPTENITTHEGLAK